MLIEIGQHGLIICIKSGSFPAVLVEIYIHRLDVQKSHGFNPH